MTFPVVSGVVFMACSVSFVVSWRSFFVTLVVVVVKVIFSFGGSCGSIRGRSRVLWSCWWSYCQSQISGLQRFEMYSEWEHLEVSENLSGRQPKKGSLNFVARENFKASIIYNSLKRTLECLDTVGYVRHKIFFLCN